MQENPKVTGQREADAQGEQFLERYGHGALRFAGAPDALYERHLKFHSVVEPEAADTRERYEAAARAVRDLHQIFIERARDFPGQPNRTDAVAG